jgi:DNA-binding MarR family transcriptional regulator
MNSGSNAACASRDPGLHAAEAGQGDRLAGLWLQLLRSASLLERDRVCCGDVTVQQCYTLALLRSEGPKTMQQTAAALGLAVSTATRNVDVLERRGALARERDAEDARVVRVALTPEGEALADRLLEGERTCCAQILELVPPERREALLTGLEDLVRAVESLRGRTGCC